MVSVRRVVPNIRSKRFDDSRVFYTEVLGFRVAMDQGWVMTVVSPDNPTAQVTFVGRDATAPEHADLSVEVDDVDAIYAEVIRRGLEIVHPLTNESWGVRRFFVRDPNGTVINVVSHRAPGC